MTAPVAGAGSAYDGSQYSSTVSAPQTAPNAPAIGTGSTYDGGHYGWSIPAPLTSPNVPISGIGSAYDGGDYGLVRTTPRGSHGGLIANCQACRDEVLGAGPASLGVSGTGSAYNGH